MMRKAALSLALVLVATVPLTAGASTPATVAGVWRVGNAGQYVVADATATLLLQIRSDQTPDPHNWEVQTDQGVWKCVNGVAQRSYSAILVSGVQTVGPCWLQQGNVAIWRATWAQSASGTVLLEGRFSP